MEHDFSINASFAAALQMLLGISMILQGMLRRSDLFGGLLRVLIPYFYSFSPVGMLIYLLYFVSFRLG